MKFYTNDDLIEKKNKKYKKLEFLKLLLFILVLLLLIYNVTLIAKAIIYPSKTPSVFGIKTFNITSGSMEPFLNIGDVVIVKEFSEDEINKDDVISFRENSTIVTHRVVDIIIEDGVKKYQTKGDNNNAVDNTLVTYNEIEGKVIKVVPSLGNYINFLKNKTVIIFVFLMFLWLYSIDMKKRDRKLMREKKKEFYLSKLDIKKNIKEKIDDKLSKN